MRLLWIASWIMFLMAVSCQATPLTTVAVITDGDSGGDFVTLESTFVGELRALTSGEFELQTISYHGGWTGDGIQKAANDAYANPAVDMLLVLGFASNQLLATRSNFPKPTFLPLVFDPGLLGEQPESGGGSGTPNLSYISGNRRLEEDLRALRRVAPFEHLAFVLDQTLVSLGGTVGDRARGAAQNVGVDIDFVAHDGRDHQIVDQLPAQTDAVLIVALPRMPAEDFDRMIEDLIQARLPAFSLAGGASSVRRGFLASDAAERDWTRLARRNALNMQAVLLGDPASDQPVVFEGKRELTINMETARRIGVSPRFDVLSEAVLIADAALAEGPELTLSEVARMAVAENLDLLAERFAVSAGAQSVTGARANRLPQIGLGAAATQRHVSPLVRAGQVAEFTGAGQLSLNQVVYADGVWASVTIAEQLQIGREQQFEQLRLDIVQASSIAFLNVLRAETQLRVQQDNLNLTRTNLELARDRVRLGSSSAADVYRWESRIADARARVLSSRATLDQSRENLNQLLNRPIAAPFQVRAPEVDAPFSITEEEFNRLVDNPASYARLTEYSVNNAIERSPELARLAALRNAKARELRSAERAYWIPDVVLSGEYSDVYSQGGVGSDLPAEEDWSLTLSATIPIFTGGARRAARSQAEAELQQIESQYASTARKVEQIIRAEMHDINAAYPTIALSRDAAEASELNLELVTDAYAQGTVSIIELLDAQNAALQAREAATNAVYDFLIEAIAAQRAAGRFDMLLSADERRIEGQRFRNFLSQSPHQSGTTP